MEDWTANPLLDSWKELLEAAATAPDLTDKTLARLTGCLEVPLHEFVTPM